MLNSKRITTGTVLNKDQMHGGKKMTPGSGILYDLGAHLIDQAFCLFGLPQFITADIRIQRPHARTTDYFELWLDYGFSKIILKAGMLVREPGPRYAIHGRLGSFIKSGEDPQEALLRKGILPTGADWGRESEDIYGLLHTETDGKMINEKYPSLAGNYGGFYNDLYNTIRKGDTLKVKPEHGYNVIRLIELATESNEKKSRITCTGLMDIALSLNDKQAASPDITVIHPAQDFKTSVLV